MQKTFMLRIALLAFVLLSVFSINANAAFVTLSGTIIESGTGNYMSGVLVTAYPTISCGSWTGAAGLTNHSGHYSMSVPDNCSFYISPTKKNYTFDPAYYLVTPSTVSEEFDFIGTFN